MHAAAMDYCPAPALSCAFGFEPLRFEGRFRYELSVNFGGYRNVGKMPISRSTC